MFAWLTGLFDKKKLKTTGWVKKMMSANEKGSYFKFRAYYDKHITRIHSSYNKDFLRFERFAKQNYKTEDQKVFMAVKTAMYAHKLGQLKVAACITAAILAHNKSVMAKNKDVVIHPRLQRATLSLHKQIVESHKSAKTKKTEQA